MKFMTLAFFALGTAAAFGQTFYGVTRDNRLVSFDRNTPGTITSNVAISGAGGDDILGIDFRPATGQLYALGSSSRLYTVDTSTGAATAVGGQFSTLLDGTEFGFDFNPTVDRVRITSNTGQNLRANPVTGGIAAVDTNLAYAAGDANFGVSPHVVGSAYTNNFVGGGTTTLYNIDSNLDVLVTQVPPNNGALNTVGSLGLNVSRLVGFDILGVGDAYASFILEGGSGTGLYGINLASGQATGLGMIGSGLSLRDLAVVPEPASCLVLAGGLLGLMRRRRAKS